MGFGQEFGQDQGDGSGRSHPDARAVDDHLRQPNRTAKLEATLTIVEISIAANAANCYIVAPGSTLTIKAVEGNSTTELDFNNAALVWQDALGMVKSVSANSTEKVVVVSSTPGLRATPSWPPSSTT